MKRSDPSHSIQRFSDRFAPYAAGLQAVFEAMDRAYTAVAATYRFVCSGCEDNCCRSLFFHFTYLELFYLQHGWETLEPAVRKAIRVRADDDCRQMAADVSGSKARRPMCPLNDNGLCRLYEYRPMICRLHGIPHALERPDGQRLVGSGCEAFARQCGSRTDVVLERTPHYAALAGLEQEFRRSTGLTDKLRLTVSDMILRFSI